LTLCAAAKAQTAYQSVVLGDNPLAYYALNPGTDGTTNAPDLSGNGNNGVPANISPAIGPTEFITNATYFDGSAAIDLSQGTNAGLLNYAGPITLEAWVEPGNPSLFSNLGDIVAKGYDASSYAYAEVSLRVNGPYGQTFTGGSENTNNSGESVYVTGGDANTTWSYVVVSMDGTNCSLYQNGVLVGQASDTGGSYVYPDDWVIGTGSDAGASRVFYGNISEVAIYNYGLTAAQVLNHYFVGTVNSPATNSPPILTSQPQSVSALLGGTATFKVAAVSAYPTTNQWYLNSAALTGQSNTTLTVTNISSAKTGTYTVVVGNTIGTTNASAILSLVTPSSLVWSSFNNNGVWDLDTTLNWTNLNNGLQAVFTNYDEVLFNDASGAPTTVTVATNVQPSLITVDTSTNSFAFSGSSISGPGSLIKEGTSLLSITTPAGITGSVTIGGGAIYAGNNCFSDVSSFTISNGATLDVAGGSLFNNKPVSVSGTGLNGEGAIFNSYNDYPSESLTVTLTGDTLFAGTARWDLATGSLISGPYNLTVDWSANSQNNYYGQWNTVTLGADVLNVFVTNGIDPSSASNLGMVGDDTICQNPETLFTVAGGCAMLFYGGGFNGNIHALSGSTIYLWSAPSVFTGNTVTLENSAGWQSTGSSSTTEPVNSAMVLNGVAHVVVQQHYVSYTNVISGLGGFVMDTSDHGMIFASADSYTGPTIIGTGGSSVELYLTNNGSISDSSLIFFGGTNADVAHIDVSGRSDQTLTLASGQTLAGIGTINGSLNVSSGATISPGGTNTTIQITTGSNPTGTLSATTNIALNGTTLIKLDGASNDVVEADGAIAYGGTLSLQNISGTNLAAGDSFQVFDAASYSGSFASITPTAPGPGLAWDTTQLSSGAISVMTATATGPTISSVQLSSGNIVLSGSGGTASGTYYLLTTTNLAVKPWLTIATNSYDTNGNFVLTNAVTPGVTQQFYLIEQ
jgi:hypothetical protein